MKPKDETKEKAIIDVTLDVVYKKGFSGLKMAEIAKNVGLSPSTLYVYFKNKEDLIVSVCTSIFAKMSGTSDTQVDLSLPYKMRLKKKWLSLVNYGLNHAKEMSFLKQIKQSDYYDKVPETVKLAKYRSGIQLVEDGKSEGLIKNMENNILLSIIGAFASETIKLINEKEIKLLEPDLDMMFLLLWDALKT